MSFIDNWLHKKPAYPSAENAAVKGPFADSSTIQSGEVKIDAPLASDVEPAASAAPAPESSVATEMAPLEGLETTEAPAAETAGSVAVGSTVEAAPEDQDATVLPFAAPTGEQQPEQPSDQPPQPPAA